MSKKILSKGDFNIFLFLVSLFVSKPVIDNKI